MASSAIAVALIALWVRRRSVLDYWLMLAVYSLILEEMLIALLSGARFSLGFYAGRVFSLITSIIVLLLLLSETTRLYARLARSHRLLEHERDNKLMNVEAITASTIVFDFKSDGPGLGKGGTGVLSVDGQEVAKNSMEHTIPVTFPEDETFDVGQDTRTGVALVEHRYDPPFKFTGKINKLTFKLEPEKDVKAKQ
jgi:hypothetical protein